MKLTDLCELEKQNSYNNIPNNKFLLDCPNGKTLICEWLDVHYGMFVVDGMNSFIKVNQLDFANDDCATPLIKTEI